MQKTIAKACTINGIGLHSGKEFQAVISPAPCNTGIQFKRDDVRHCDYTRITPYNVSSTQLATTIDCGGLPISTIEHFSAAFYGQGIDNAFISVSGTEVPILDGSAKEVIENIEKAGILTQKEKRKVLKVTRPVSIEYEGKTVEIEPCDNFEITFELDYPHPVIGRQVFTYVYDENTFHKEIGIARTFGFKREVEALWSMGLAKGGSLDNAIVIDDKEGVLNKEGLRFPNEFVRHKILDMFGDLALIGYRLQGKIKASKSGHHVNNVFARTLLEATNSYVIEEETESKVIKEQAASCQKVLGGWANIALEYATKRYRSNLINWGMVPFTISKELVSSGGEPPFGLGDYIFVPGIKEAVEKGSEKIKAYVISKDSVKEIELMISEKPKAGFLIIKDYEPAAVKRSDLMEKTVRMSSACLYAL